MAFVIHGKSKTLIGYDEVLLRCPSCEKSSWADISVTSHYIHVFWVPVFPYAKTVSVFCNECGLKRYDLPFNADFIPTYPEIKHKFRHPVRTYIFSILFVLIIIYAVVS